MEKIIWNDDWNTGISIIDEQHKTLVTILNKIITNEINVNELMLELIKYSGRHFADEERYMVRYKYPIDDYDYHRNEHVKFTELLLDISFEVIKSGFNGKEVIKKFETFCFIWFNKHVLETDKKLGNYLKSVDIVD